MHVHDLAELTVLRSKSDKTGKKLQEQAKELRATKAELEGSRSELKEARAAIKRLQEEAEAAKQTDAKDKSLLSRCNGQAQEERKSLEERFQSEEEDIRRAAKTTLDAKQAVQQELSEAKAKLATTVASLQNVSAAFAQLQVE